jgi:hypothetical protein
MSMSSVVMHLKGSQSGQKTQSSINLVDECGATISSYLDIGFVQPIKTSGRFLDGSIDVLKGNIVFLN